LSRFKPDDTCEHELRVMYEEARWNPCESQMSSHLMRHFQVENTTSTTYRASGAHDVPYPESSRQVMMLLA
jgi:hypothetical protein